MTEGKKIKTENSVPMQRKGSILIVDDVLAVRRVLQEFLNSKGFETHSASCAAASLEILNEIEVDLVITNIWMPGMKGLELTRLIRDRYDAHVMIFTGYRNAGTHKEVICIGASELLYKPAKMEGLLNSINRILDSGTNRDTNDFMC